MREGYWEHRARWQGKPIEIPGEIMRDAIRAPMTRPYRLHLRVDPAGRYYVAPGRNCSHVVSFTSDEAEFTACYLDDRWVGQRVSVQVERRPARPRRAR